MAFDGRAGIVDIDEDEKVVIFDTYKLKKITGTRVGPILGMSEFSSPFKVACELAGLYPGDKANKYIDAGNILEPVLRDYLAARPNLMRDALSVPEGSKVGIEEPVPKEQCGYDHFHDNKVFGGLVDGYIAYGGKRQAILEIKTSHDKERWLDEEGNVTIVPQTYMMQAGLYAELSGLDKIVFAVGFLEDADYDRPNFWVPTPENTVLITVDRPDMSGPMTDAEKWYHEYIDAGETPAWTDKDADLVKWLKSYDPNAKKKNGPSKNGRRRF